MKRLLIAVALVIAGTSLVEGAKEYSADRFDVRLEVQPGGAMQVTETIVFRFSGGTFTNVFRDVPRNRTDNLQFVRVTMDGAEFHQGEGAGSYEIRGGSKNRVRWHFAPTTGSHTFELTYLVHGVVRREPGADLLWWRALPAEHAYRIAGSVVDVQLPAEPHAPIEIGRHAVESATQRTDGRNVSIEAYDIRKNGWISVAIRMPAGSVIQAPPEWQQRHERAAASGPKWLMAGGAIVLLGFILLFAMRQGYDSPPADLGTSSSAPSLPDTLDAPLAGALVTNGSVRLEQAMAALFRLADRGDVRIEEQPKSRWGQRVFTVRRTAGARPVRPYEETLLNLVFTGRHGSEDAVELGKARMRVGRKFAQFRASLQGELTAEGLIDADRMALCRRYRVVAVVMVIVAAMSPLAMIPFFDAYEAWPIAITGAFIVVSLAALIASAAHTPLSNEGVRRKRQWTLYRKYLNDVARDRAPVEDSAARLLPFAVALGAAAAWSKYLKQHRVELPPWFHTADGTAAGFPYFVAAGGSGASGHGAGGAGGGAAGGGASGAS